MSILLIPEPPLQVLPKLAAKIGLNNAIVLQQIHYWIQQEHIGKTFNGQRYVRNSLVNWQKTNFPFWSTRTIQRIFQDLEEEALISVEQMGHDRTKWYSINYHMLNMTPEPIRTKKAGKKNQPQLGDIMAETPVEEKVKDETPWQMAGALIVVMRLDEAVVGRKRYTAFGSKLLKAGYTIENIQNWFGDESGYWYTTTFKGKKGLAPNQSDVTKHLVPAKEYGHTEGYWAPQ